MLDKIFGSGLPEVPEPEPRKLFDRERTGTVTIQTSRGNVDVLLSTFAAMTGWEVKSYAKDFYSEDRAKFQRFTAIVLAYASVEGTELSDEATANGLLERWQNVETVVRAVLDHNGIDLSANYVMREDLSHIGTEMAKAFWAAGEGLIKPTLEALENGSKA